MESESVVDSKMPLLNEAYAYGVVEHPFPLNCLIRDWHLGPEFYHAVKIGIVQYVCANFFAGIFLQSLFSFHIYRLYFLFTGTISADDTENDMCSPSNDS